MFQGKTQTAENGPVLLKGCNAVLEHLGTSLRASWEAVVRGAASLGKDRAITCVLQHRGQPLPSSLNSQLSPGWSTNRITRMRFLLSILAIISCSACAGGSPSVEIGGKQFSVELARTREEQTLGLMYRDELPADHGMLFVFPAEAPRSFWMKNTRIPLDILYFDSQLTLVSAALDTPPCRVSRCPAYPSISPSMYVLELNAGTASDMGVKLGDRLTIDLK